MGIDLNTHFHRKMQEVRENLLGMAGLVEAAMQDAFQAMVSRNPQKARAVIDGDRRIDLMENEIDEKAITLLATHQPVAVDLRFLSVSIRICSFLERMGDQSVNLAWRAITLAEMEHLKTPRTIGEMFDIAFDMTRSCLDAFVQEDVELAMKVIRRDDEVDALVRRFLEENITWMNQENRLIRRGVEHVLASRHIERMADEATNIAEEVVFLVEGEIIRHHDKKNHRVNG